jgi:ribonucleoside-triphosphate reductase
MKPESTVVFSFPQRAPAGAVVRENLTAIQHLELWRTYQDHWCEHKPSVTVTYRDDEFPEVAAYVWKHLDGLSGVSFLPHSDHTYRQAPYQDCTEAEYMALKARMPAAINWQKLAEFEAGIDTTTGTQELACTAGGCEIQ